ncbi:glycosyltransferase family 9 protein [Psychromonas ossibalaenae]|uniref:glycosyltransferase family 9 protein n=1 Tax=Psychromonas ossibalaenae TaxID=444922 RepID=UPI0003813991|nr:glycosyltransferase family 9 protein [Psychromonas ossibalaenae]
MKVLIIRSGALGDTVFASAAISAIQQILPDDTLINWLGAPLAHSLFEHDPRIQHVYSIKHKKIPILFNSDKKRIISDSLSAPYDLIINLENSPYFVSLMKKINAEHKVGQPYTEGPVEQNNEHAVDAMLRIVELGLAKLKPNCNLKQSAPTLIGTDFAPLQKKFNLTKPYIVLHPGNSHVGRSNPINYRAWPSSHWQVLAKNLAETYKETHQVILIGSPEEKLLVDVIEKEAADKELLNLCGKTTISELITLIENAAGIITTDTGPSHIASAVNTPVFAIIGPNDYRQTGPYSHAGNYVEIISLALPCSPCLPDGSIKQCTNNICMQELQPQLVMQKISKHLDKSK